MVTFRAQVPGTIYFYDILLLMEKTLTITPASKIDFEEIWPLFKSVISTGDTYVFPPSMSFQEAQAYWMNPNNRVYIARKNNTVVGTYIFKANQIGLGSHIANASFMVSPNTQGQGIGKKMAQYCLQEAKSAGFLAMQFNIVISTNKPAIHLWKKLEFSIIGTTPKAFKHQSLGLVDAHIMHKEL